LSEPDTTHTQPAEPGADSGAARAVTETERKYRVHGLYRLPDLVSAGAVAGVDDLGTTMLDATYFDTDDLRLAREGITLRRRAGGDDEGWHLKLPVSASGFARTREEIQLPLTAGDLEDVPGELRHLVGVLVRDDDVRPVATLRTERRSYRLWPLPTGDEASAEAVDSTDEGADEAPEQPGEPGESGEAPAPPEPTPVAVLTDDLVSVLDNDGTMVARFRELELEDAPDVDRAVAESTASAVSAVLVSAGAVTGEFVSKAVRALGPFAASPPEVSEPGEVTPDDAARDAVRAHLARHTRRLREADMGVRRDLDDSVHQMRVAARRLRSGLRVFRPLLDQEWADELRVELAWVAGELGDYRDTEVLLERLENHLDLLPDGIDPEPAREHVERVLTQRLTEARQRTLAMLDSKRYYDLQVRLVAAAADPVTTDSADLPSRQVVPPLVERAWKKLAKEAAQLLADEIAIPGGAPDSEWHASRITAKKARYAAEAAAPVFGANAAAFAKQLARVTEVLGNHQDAAIAIERIKELAAEDGTSAPAAFGLGALLSVEHDSVAETRTEFSTLWRGVSRRRWRRWLWD
jgi:CHAD domain-containing protein